MVEEILIEDGRVVSIKGHAKGGETISERARIVVGADGRNSTVAKLTGARKYHVVPGQRFAYWGFFEGAVKEGQDFPVLRYSALLIDSVIEALAQMLGEEQFSAYLESLKQKTKVRINKEAIERKQ